MKIAIIGSGIGGLATAIKLAKLGLEIDVYEKNSHVGGKIEALKKNGYTFDLGPSVFTEPENVLELLGENLSDNNVTFEYKKLDSTFHYFFNDHKLFIAYSDKQKLIKEFVHVLNEDEKKVRTYLDTIHRLEEKVSSYFLNNPNDLYSVFFKNPIKTIKVMSHINPQLLYSKLASWNKMFFKSKEANQIVNKFGTYVFSNSYQMPAIFSVIGNLELNKGVFYPKGGMKSIVDALFDKAKNLGVKFHFQSEVKNIITKGNVVEGVKVGQQNTSYDYIISNMDEYYTHTRLLKEPLRKKAKKLGNSGVVFYWGIKKNYKEMNLHNNFFSSNYHQEHNDIFKKRVLPEDPTLYVNITSVCEPSMAPKGCQNWFVMVNCPSDISCSRDELISMARKRAISKISKYLKDDFEHYIDFEKVRTPHNFQSLTHTFMGSIGGESFNTLFSNFTRHKNKSKKYKNLFFVGGTVHPGPGLPLCFRGAKIIEKYFNNLSIA